MSQLVAGVAGTARLWFARDIVAWTLGGLVAAGMFVGGLLPRRDGLVARLARTASARRSGRAPAQPPSGGGQ